MRTPLARKRASDALRAIGHPGSGAVTVCCASVLAACGVGPGTYKFAQSVDDVVAILRRKGLTVRDCRKELPPVATAKSASDAVTKLPFKSSRYLLRVAGHLSLVAGDGTVLSDTDTRFQSASLTHAYRIQ